jgi:putative transposase
MQRTFKYRLLGNKETLVKAESWLVLCHCLYNLALEQRIKCYQQYGKTLSSYEQINQLIELKKDFPEYKEVGSQVLQDVVERLDRAYKGFFRRVKNGDKNVGLPRFKSRDRYNSFTLKQTNWKLEGKYLAVYNLGRFKIRLSRQIEGRIKTITIRKQLDKWYVCFNCDNVPEKKLQLLDKSVGIDVGIKTFCVDSDGNQTESPKYFRNAEKQLRVRQRILSNRVKGSQSRKDAQLLVAKAHEKVANQRNDFLHKVTNHYITNYGVVCIEDLNIQGMVKNHHLAKSITDASWGKFFEMLEYKAEEAGRQLIKVPRFEPTSKACSNCGVINEDLTLNDRQWVCKSCGVLHDRDFNAAKNICRVGQTLQESTYENTQCVS